jgi:group I intron endonuclease
MKSGVYSITCIANGRVYVGSSCDLRDRWQSHKTRLNCGVHSSKLMQQDYNLYGLNSFEFKALKFTDARLTAWEQYWQVKLGCLASGYNSYPAVGLRPDLSSVTRSRMSQSKIGNTNSKGHKLSETHKLKLLEANKLRNRSTP